MRYSLKQKLLGGASNAKKQQVQAEQGLFALGDNIYIDDEIFKKEKAEPIPSFPFTTFLGEKIKGPESLSLIHI